MSKENFTPAPWRVVKTKNRVIEIQDQNCCIIADVELDHNYQNKLIKNYPIPITAEANAKLIAAAPEMFEALKVALMSIPVQDAEAFFIVENAIKKAVS